MGFQAEGLLTMHTPAASLICQLPTGYVYCSRISLRIATLACPLQL